MNIKLILFLFCITTTFPQTIEIEKKMPDTSNFGIKLEAEGVYNPSTKIIGLSENYYDMDAVHSFIHELGHHIWYYGGIDTTTIIFSLESSYFSHNDILELFAEQHWKYFWNQAYPAFKKIFDEFYNRRKDEH